ncbi:MAG: hypothetical protein LBR11_03525 [Deltaproteobacteria bacterium]|jgi:hypothetical protein|nr:hypothetical protein [Deltaproteobacteria bacterium]
MDKALIAIDSEGGGCVDPLSGLYRPEHFFIALDKELARLSNAQGALGILLISFPMPPNWATTGREIVDALGGCDQAARLGEAGCAVLMPEVSIRKVVRVLRQLGQGLGELNCGLALAWPGQTPTAEGLLTLAKEREAELAVTLKSIDEDHGSWERDTALRPAEKDSLFQGFGLLNAGK